ncbi:uncharacterized protein LOC136084512 [Hydra vulgaris]|uniref:Uncharacterized protein LOC136084512 n=1 Tax=Hydra vulgaris TaxID=6087 RepID=A0ABM4CG24_HYDVU
MYSFNQMNFLLLFLSFIILYVQKTYSKPIIGKLTCGKDKDGSDIFKTVDGQLSCAVCLCGNLNEGISYQNCETCCCGYVSKTKINNLEHFEKKSEKDERELFETKIGLYTLMAFCCLFISLMLIYLYRKKRFRSSHLPVQSTEKDEFMNDDVKVTTNHETIENTDKQNMLPN